MEGQPAEGMLQIAIELTQLGWKVFPVHGIKDGRCTCRKGPECGKNSAKHPVWIEKTLEHGLEDATTDGALLREWYASPRCQGANLAIRTGKESGIVVIDVDAEKGGLESWAELQLDNEFVPPTVVARTGREGGRHFYFRHPGFPIGNRADLLPGIDVRADGGYVIAPGSLHLSGRRYEWQDSPLDGVAIASIPEWLLQLLQKAAAAPAKSKKKTAENSGSSPASSVITEGSRNDTLFRLGSSMRGRGFEEGSILAALLEHNRASCSPPLPESEVRKIAHSCAGLEANRIPRSSPSEGDYGMLWDDDAPPGIREPDKPKKYHWTDLGNAERLRDTHGRDLRYCATWGKFLHWNGRSWDQDECGGASIHQLAASVVRSMQTEAWATDEKRKEFVEFALKCESRSKLENMVSIVQKLSGIPVAPSDLDVRRELLNVANGTIELGPAPKLREHRREDMLTRLIEIEYDESAECPRWMQFLEDIFLGKEDVMRLVWKAVGYSATGLDREQCFFFLHGGGRNGKTTFIEVLRHVFGTYAKTTATETFMVQERGRGPSEDLARLKEARFVSASETEEGGRLAEALVKRITGSEPIPCRFLFQGSFEYLPEWKLWMYGNHKPRIRNTDNGIWRRIRYIPFEYTVPPEKVDSKLIDKLLEEAPGILRWVVRGCAAWYREGIGTAQAITEATAEYRLESDVIGRFLEECTIRLPGEAIAVGKLYNAYKAWCKRTKEYEMSLTKFGTGMKERGDGSVDRSAGKFFEGLVLRDLGEDGDAAPKPWAGLED